MRGSRPKRDDRYRADETSGKCKAKESEGFGEQSGALGRRGARQDVRRMKVKSRRRRSGSEGPPTWGPVAHTPGHVRPGGRRGIRRRAAALAELPREER